MPMILTVVGIIVLAALMWLFVRMRSQDLIEEKLSKRRGAAARAATRADFVEGPNTFPVALSLTGDRVVYENADLDAYLEIKNLDEIEYDDETATGHSVQGSVLRLRSHGHAFEFVLDSAAAKQWQATLPPTPNAPKHRQAV